LIGVAAAVCESLLVFGLRRGAVVGTEPLETLDPGKPALQK
jgi:hypothetical protein